MKKIKPTNPKTSACCLLPSAFPRGFTLIELLVVISIIAILAGMVMPMFYSAKESARKAKAKVEVKALETAFKSYLDTYKTWPVSWSGNKPIDGAIFTTLRGDNSSDNPQRIAFYDFGNTNSTETKAYDPWADPSGPARDIHVYQFMVDDDYNNQITLPSGEIVYRCVAVWSLGGKDGVPVESWK